MTLWRPDTCDCQIVIEDNQGSANYGQAVQHVVVCQYHANLSMNHTAVLAENQKKNQGIATASTVGTVSGWAVNPPTRKFTIGMVGANAVTKAQANALLASQFPDGSIVVA